MGGGEDLKNLDTSFSKELPLIINALQMLIPKRVELFEVEF